MHYVYSVNFQYKSPKPPTTYTRVNDFRPHRDSLFTAQCTLVHMRGLIIIIIIIINVNLYSAFSF